MNIIFKKITIENFKGCIGKRNVVFNPRKTMILGANHSGKTTTADAANWVLFGKNSQGKSDFGITPTNERNEPIPYLENIVTLDLTADGKEYSLQRVRKEKWGRIKQQTEETLQGYTTLYFVNGEKYTEKEYKAFVDGLISESLFRAITNPEYFPSLKPEEQRQLLIKMVGVKSDEEIAAENPEFATMLKSIEGQDVKEYRQQISYKMKELKKAMEDIPGRISERNKEINDIRTKGYDYTALANDLEDKNEKLKGNREKIKDSSSLTKEDIEKKIQLRSDIKKLKDKQYVIEQQYDDDNKKADEEKKDLGKKIEKIKKDIKSEENKLKEHKKEIEEFELRKADFRKEWKNCEDMEFAWDDTNENCPNCGQRLPQEDIEKLKKDARKRFNERKTKKQDELDKTAAKIKAEDAKNDAEKRSLEKKIKNLKDDLAETERLEKADVIHKDFKDDENWQAFEEKIQSKDKEIKKIDDSKDVDVEANVERLEKENAELEEECKELVNKLADVNTISNAEKRIQELTEQQRTLNQQLADLEKQDYTAEQFQFAVIQDLQDRVNELFPTIRFKMFNTLLNGNVEPTCVLTMNGVSYPNLSTSEKIVAGLECIEAMCQFNQSFAPIWVDNSESITSVPQTTSQQILLVVSAGQPLTVVNEMM